MPSATHLPTQHVPVEQPAPALGSALPLLCLKRGVCSALLHSTLRSEHTPNTWAVHRAGPGTSEWDWPEVHELVCALVFSTQHRLGDHNPGLLSSALSVQAQTAGAKAQAMAKKNPKGE